MSRPRTRSTPQVLRRHGRAPRAVLMAILTAAVGLAALVAASSAAAARSDGARPVPVSGLGGSLQNPCFSPNGDRLAFTRWPRRYNEGLAEVHVVPLLGGPPQRVSQAGATSVNLPGSCWNGPLDRITFSAEVDGPDAVWIASPLGTDRHEVLQRPRHVSIEPSFSPDGDWIVFESSIYDAEGPGSIWKVRLDGSGLTRLSRGRNDRQPNWSPAGDRIVFQRDQGNDTFDLITIDPNGGSLRNVTRTRRASETDVAWSPDGLRLVYSGGGPGVDIASLFVIGADGRGRRRVTRARGYYDGAPTWSPDGSTIVFESRRGEPDGSRGTRLWRVAAPI